MAALFKRGGPTVAPAVTGRQERRPRFRPFRWLLGIMVVLLVGFLLYTWFTLTWSYSEGERAGYVQKFSKRGWLFKTWEGELAMVTMPGATPEKWQFSCRDDSAAARINRFMGRRVVLKYEQHVGVPLNIFGETEYYVVDAWQSMEPELP